MDVPTFPVEKTLPILLVLFEPEKAMKCNKTTPLVRGSRRIDYHVEMKKLQGTLPKNVKELGDDSNYEYCFLPPVWRVKLSDNTTAFSTQQKIIDLFGAPFATEVEYRGHVGKRYIHIPVGATREERLPFIPSLQRSDAPTIQFMQGEFDTCIYSSFASALHYLGVKQPAHHISQCARKDAGQDPFTVFQKLDLRLKKMNLGFLRTRKITSITDYVKDIKDNMIVVASLKDSSGNASHAVTICRGWIFDSNETSALPLCKQALDVCTQSEQEAIECGLKSTFVTFGVGRVFVDKTKDSRLNNFAKISSVPTKSKKRETRRKTEKGFQMHRTIHYGSTR